MSHERGTSGARLVSPAAALSSRCSHRQAPCYLQSLTQVSNESQPVLSRGHHGMTCAALSRARVNSDTMGVIGGAGGAVKAAADVFVMTRCRGGRRRPCLHREYNHTRPCHSSMDVRFKDGGACYCGKIEGWCDDRGAHVHDAVQATTISSAIKKALNRSVQGCWRPREGSNLQPTAPEAVALSD